MKSKTTYPILIGCLLAAGALVQDAGAQAAPKHRYSFDDSGDGVTVTDSVGGQNGMLINTTGSSAFADGQLTLGNDGSQGSNASPITGDYVDLPNGMFSDLVPGNGVTAFTLEGWYTWQGSGDWQRFYDVGRSLGGEDISDRADNQPNFFIAVKAGGVAGSRAAWTGRGIGEVSISSGDAATAAAGVPHHVAFVWDEATTSARYFVDGELVGENTETALSVQNDFAGDDVNNWLGRSNWPDTLFVGSFDEFRVYDEALDQQQVLNNFVDGPDTLNGAGTGAFSGITASAGDSEILAGGTTSVSVRADYENAASLHAINSGVAYSSDNMDVVTVDEFGVVTGVGLGTANIMADYSGQSSSVSISVLAPASIASSAAVPELIVNGSTTISTIASYGAVVDRDITNIAGMTYSSANDSIATVSEAGEVTGVNPGDVTITVEFGGLTSDVAITVTLPPFPTAVLEHRYSFSDSVGSDTVMDSVGDAHGEARNITFDGAGTAAFVSEEFSHVSLPNGIISDNENLTLEAWATYDGLGGPWQRIFDLGNTEAGEDPPYGEGAAGYDGSDTSYIFYTPRSGGSATLEDNGGRVAYQKDLDDRVGGEAAENPNITVPGGQGPIIGEPFHLVFIYNYTYRNASIYINGANVGEQAIPADRPLSGIEDVNNWLGRSQWSGDDFLTGTFDEFRIYEGALTPLQVAVNNVVGPDTQVDDLGAVQGMTLSVVGDAPVAGGAPVEFSLIADFENVQGIEIASAGVATISSSDSSVLKEFNGGLIPVAAGTATLTASLEGVEVSEQITVGANPTTPVLEHRFSFEGDLVDSVGGLNDGTLQGGAMFENGGVTLPGGATDAGFIDLPDYMFSDYYFDVDPANVPALTFEAYGNWAGGGAWQRILSLGDNDGTNGRTFLFVSPSNGGGQLQASFQNDNDGAQVVTGPGLTPEEDFYVALVFDPIQRVMRLYRNGELVGLTEFSAGIDISNDLLDLVVNDENEWLGRSQYVADPGFGGSITEYRIWNGALLDADVALHAACGPDELTCEITGPTDPLPISAGLTAEGVVISWSSEGENLQLQVTDVIAPANWQDVATPPVTEGDTTSVTISDLTGAGYFRLINP